MTALRLLSNVFLGSSSGECASDQRFAFVARRHPYKINFLLSFVFHVVLFAIFTLSISSKKITEAIPETSILSTTLIQSTVSALKEGHKARQSQKHILQATKKVSHPSNSAAFKSNATNTNILLQKLHDAIAQYADYPEGLIAHNQKVILTMKVSPNGTLSDIVISQSSGSSFLDEKTLEAAKHASPVKDVGKFLKRTGVFAVTVIYL